MEYVWCDDKMIGRRQAFGDVTLSCPFGGGTLYQGDIIKNDVETMPPSTCYLCDGSLLVDSMPE